MAKKAQSKKSRAKKATRKTSKTARPSTKKSTRKFRAAGRGRTKAVGKKTSGRKSNGHEMLLVSSKTKQALKSGQYNVSQESLDALNEQVYQIVEQAQKRCAANGRKTIRPHDILAR